MNQKSWYKIVSINSPEGVYRDVYHTLMRSSWPVLFLYYVLMFLLLNLFFATLYTVVPGSISAKPYDFKSAFFFSVQTFSTVGYGTISPQNFYGNIVVVFEIMTGVLSVALTTGLAFAKFSKPSAKLIYSNQLLLSSFENEPVIMFRVANARSNQITSANIELHRVYSFITVDGDKITRFAPLKLIRNYSPVFALSWSVYHPIDRDSPYYGKSADEILKSKDEFYVIFHGIDGTFSQSIHDTHFYKIDDLLINHRFVDILHRDEAGTRYIDYEKFHHSEPLAKKV